MDRTKAPEIRDVKSIAILPPKQYSMGNGGQLYHLSEIDEDAVKIDLIFDAGSSRHNKLVSQLTSDLLLSGTVSKSSDTIEESIDQLGGFTNIEVGVDDCVVSVLGLKEHILKILEIVTDAIHHVEFNEREFKQTLAYQKQKFNVNMEKVSTLARREFISAVFPSSSYGELTQASDFDHLNKNDLIKFHKNHYLKALQKIAVVGDIDQKMVQRIIHLTSEFDRQNRDIEKNVFEYEPKEIELRKKGALQTAVRIGRILFNKEHEDFIDFNVLNALLGGYFGSRLMSSIREDKGYTYGIGSGVAQLLKTGYFFISTEVGEEYKDLTIDAIKHEIERLQNELVSDEELGRVKNYLTGQLLKNADGPFAQMDRFLSVEKHGKDLSYYNEVLKGLNTVTAERIQELARTYLNWEDLIIVKAG